MLEQPWLLTKYNPYIISSPIQLQRKMVASLLCTDRKEWDVKVLSDVLNERDQSCIMVIPISESGNEDIIFWSFEDSGNYSVKSAYRLLQSQRGA